MKRVRTSTKAIVIENGRLLAVRNRDCEGDWYMLPGGGQHHNESLHEALTREFDEEVGGEIAIGPLRFVRDYISNNHEFADEDGNLHQVEFYFECELLTEVDETCGHTPDMHQHGVQWLKIEKLEQYRLYPKHFQQLFKNLNWREIEIYLGDIN